MWLNNKTNDYVNFQPFQPFQLVSFYIQVFSDDNASYSSNGLKHVTPRDVSVMEKSSIDDFSNRLVEANVKAFHNFIIFLQLKNKEN